MQLNRYILSLCLTLLIAFLTSCAGTGGRHSGEWERQVEGAKLALNAIRNANLIYRLDHKQDAANVEELISKDYLMIDDETTTWFRFELVKDGRWVKEIKAVSTEVFVEGAGKEIILYDYKPLFKGELAR